MIQSRSNLVGHQGGILLGDMWGDMWGGFPGRESDRHAKLWIGLPKRVGYPSHFPRDRIA